MEELSYQKYRQDIVFLFPKFDEREFKFINLCSVDDEILNLNFDKLFIYSQQFKKIDVESDIFKRIVNIDKPKFIYIDDLHGFDTNIEILNNFTNVFCPYKYLLSFMKINLLNVIKCPHYIHNKFLKYNKEPSFLISLLGHISHETYYTRKLIHQNINEINSDLIDVKINVYKKVDPKKYFEILQNSYGSIATTGDNPNIYLPYIVSKYFEIPGCGSLLIAHLVPEIENELNNYGFTNQINFVGFRTINDLIEICNDISKNKEKYDNIRINGFNLIKNNHTIHHRINHILKYC